MDFSSSSTLGTYVPYAYDAIHALALSIHAAIEKGNEPKGKALLDELLNVSFTGITGSVTFASNGDRGGEMKYVELTPGAGMDGS